jgi:hypothetical protein
MPAKPDQRCRPATKVTEHAPLDAILAALARDPAAAPASRAWAELLLNVNGGTKPTEERPRK